MAPATPRVSLLAFALCICACARIVAPEGGPEDTEPPSLISVDPPAGPGLPGLRRIEIRYDERLDESSAEVALYPPLDCRIDVSGRTIRIELEEPLSGGVLVLHLPNTLRDKHGNSVGAPLDLAWSGTDSLPSAAVAMTFARQGGGVTSDRVIAEVSVPGGGLVRRTAADTSYSAVAGWLEPGSYSITAYEDPDYSFTWEPEAEAGGDTLILLEAGDTLRLSMVLGVVDTIGPRLTDAAFVDIHHAVVQFSEQVRLPESGQVPFVLRDSTGAAVPVLGTWKTGARDERSLVLATAATRPGPYSLSSEGLFDMVGNPGPPDSLEMEGTDSVATDSLEVRSMYPAPGATEAPPSGPYSFSFSDWVDPDSVSARLSLTRVSDGSTVGVSTRNEDGRSFIFTPDRELLGEEQYRVRIESGLVSLQGDTLGTSSWSFVPAWGTDPGAIEGSVRGGYDATLEIAPAGRSGDVLRFRSEGGAYRAEPVPAGRYTVTAYADLNGNGEWDGADGEPYGAAPGVVLVRPGQTTSEVDIEVLP